MHQLCRENWFYQLPKMLAWIGYVFFEPFYLWLFKNKQVITVSESSKQSLLQWGFKKDSIHIISEGIKTKPINKLSFKKKFSKFTLLSFGDIRPMKQTHHQIKAFEIAKKSIPQLQMILVGKLGGSYGVKILDTIDRSEYRKDIFYYGFVDEQKKANLMKRSHLILQTATREGWGLTITEANSKGTPAVVYNTDGLRDSVKHNTTGLICKKNTPSQLAANIIKIYCDKKMYKQMAINAWNFSKEITFENSAEDFKRTLRKMTYKNNQRKFVLPNIAQSI
jgi:glycosyltransferase involved in cell wall biosynthesis